jgi:protein-S-isoprenylcysteine O-methyltransferase Ste14
MKSKILVSLQFGIAILMMIPFGAEFKHPFVAFVIVMFASVIGMSAIKTHRRGSFNIRPDLKEGCELVTHGIYRYIRHPMYLSVLILLFGVVVLYNDSYRWALYLFLWGVMVMKLLYEEHLWCCYTQEYEEYKKKTKRLVPFIF